MQRKFLLFFGAMIAWLIVGVIIGGISAVIVGYTWLINVMIYGAIIGTIVGCLHRANWADYGIYSPV